MLFNPNLSIFKPVSFFLIAIMIANLFMFAILVKPQPTKAIFGAGDIVFDPAAVAIAIKDSIVTAAKWVWDKAKWVKENTYDVMVAAFNSWEKSENILAKVSYTLMYITVNIMIAKMTQDIITWIDGGAHGSPKIMQDPNKELRQALDIAGAEVTGALLGLDSGQLCNPNFLKVDLVLEIDKFNQPTVFQNDLKCSFQGGRKAWQAFKEDFRKGGWKSWIKLGEGANNDFGNILETQKELARRGYLRANTVKTAIDVGKGFKAVEVCRVTQIAELSEKGVEDLVSSDFESMGASQLAELYNRALEEDPVDTLRIQGLQEAMSNLEHISLEASVQKLERLAAGNVASGANTGATVLGTTYTLGSELDKIMPNYGFGPGQLEEFKKYWVSFGGKFECKIQTPAQVAADMFSKAVMAPFETVNKIASDSLAAVGKAAPQILQPYLAAISTSALNLLVKGEKKWLSERVLGLTPVRKFPRQNSDNFKDANATLDASKSLLGSTLSLREMLMQTALEFTLFTGTLRKISEKKSLLNDWSDSPIIPADLKNTGLIWNYITVWMTDGRSAYLDPVISATSSDQFIADETERVVTAEVKANMPNGFPTLPPAGVMSIVANACGAPTQEILPTWGATTATNLSPAIGYIIGAELKDLSYANNGWNGDTRITAFDDNGDAIADRFVREKSQIGRSIGPSNIITFINAGIGENDIIPDCVGSCSHKSNYDKSLPPDGTLDVYDPTMDPNIYYSELATFDVANERLRTDPYGSSAQRVYYHPGEADQILGGNIFVITDSKHPVADAYQENIATTSCVDDVPMLKYTKSGSVGVIHSGGGDPKSSNWGANCGGSGYTNPVFSIDWGQFSNSDSVTVFVTFDGNTDSGCVATTDMITMTIDKSTPSDTTATNTTRLCTGSSPKDQHPQMSVSYSSTKYPLILNGNRDKKGIPAYTEDSKYLKKFFSPSYGGAGAAIQNSRRTAIYDDFLDGKNTPTTMKSLKTKEIDDYPAEDPRGSIFENLPYIEHDNPNPYKMLMSNFYDELNEALDEFMVKTRVLLGYTQSKEDTTHLSGLADQIGSVPDEDPTSTSTSDVLTRYNDLADLYQTLFTGFSSETSLEGIDPEYKVLSPVETNIKLALIGKRCPTIPPTADSSQALKGGCPEFEGQYNMAKRFIFEQDDPTGFATNPFTGINSRVLAGILNLDEMTQQLASLPPDKNIIKLIRLRQILEQLQVYPKQISIEGKGTNADIIPPKLQGVDVVQLSLRNYPEIEAYLNDTTTQNKKIGELITAYGFTDPNNTKEAYPAISSDLENILPDIVTQISDKLKDVFLKRTELELANAKVAAQERLLDFIYFANDLNPAVQLQIPAGLSFGFDGETMQLDSETGSIVIRVVASQMSNISIKDPNGNNFTDAKGNIIYEPLQSSGDFPAFAGLGPCMSISGEKIDCATAEQTLRGFKTTSFGKLQSKIKIASGTTAEDISAGIAIRQALMAGIRKKIKIFSAMIGIDTTSADFKSKIDSYILPSKTDSSGRQNIDITQWDWAIQKGLEDVNVLFTAVYSNNLPGTYANRPTNALYFDNNHAVLTDVQSKMDLLRNNFSLIQNEVEKIIEKFSSSGSSDLMSIKPDMEDLNKLLATMEVNFDAAEACATGGRVRSGSSSLGDLMIAGATLGSVVPGLGTISGAIVGAGADWIGGLFGASWSSKSKIRRAKKKAKKAAEPCNKGATEYNKATLQLMNKFVCGQTWSEPQQ